MSIVCWDELRRYFFAYFSSFNYLIIPKFFHFSFLSGNLWPHFQILSKIANICLFFKICVYIANNGFLLILVQIIDIFQANLTLNPLWFIFLWNEVQTLTGLFYCASQLFHISDFYFLTKSKYLVLYNLILREIYSTELFPKDLKRIRFLYFFTWSHHTSKCKWLYLL